MKEREVSKLEMPSELHRWPPEAIWDHALDMANSVASDVPIAVILDREEREFVNHTGLTLQWSNGCWSAVVDEQVILTVSDTSSPLAVIRIVMTSFPLLNERSP